MINQGKHKVIIKNGNSLAGAELLLGVTGSIALYKAANLASKLVQQGALVNVVMTQNALEFITPLTFGSLTHRPVLHKLFDPESELGINHVALAENSAAILVAPATADIIAKAANGLADDLLSCILLATRRPVILAPAMDGFMWDNPATQENLSRLQKRGWGFVGPVEGRLASGLIGKGRLASSDHIIGGLKQTLGKNGDLEGKTVLVTAGGTEEAIDPVRHLSNRSTGKMGYALAEAARDRGAKVLLVSAPTYLDPPYGVDFISVRSAENMHAAVLSKAGDANIIIMAAAVADYQPVTNADHKIKKTGSNLILELQETTDILAEVTGQQLVKVGFAAESQDLAVNARAKLKKKGLDLIVVNDITASGIGFGSDDNRVSVIDKNDVLEDFPLMSKIEVAHKVLDKVVRFTGDAETI